MATFLNIGPTGQGTVGASALSKNTLVKFGTTGKLETLAADDYPDGVVQDDFAIGATATFYRTQGGHFYVLTTGTVVTGDFIKSAASGAVQADGTSGATALSLKTIGRLLSDPDTGGYALAVLR